MFRLLLFLFVCAAVLSETDGVSASDGNYFHGVMNEIAKRFRRSPFDSSDYKDDLSEFDMKDFEYEDDSKSPSSNEIPPETLDQFTPPEIRDPKIRHAKYSMKAPVGDLMAADFIVNDEPFFETFDHGTVVLALQNYRRTRHIPFQKLLSIRPFFPFFVNT